MRYIEFSLWKKDIAPFVRQNWNHMILLNEGHSFLNPKYTNPNPIIGKYKDLID